MTEVIGVRFKKVGKVYYFDPNGLHAAEGEYVIVETARGVECGEVAMPNSEVSDNSIVKPLKKVLRKAGESDLKVLEENARLEKEAFRICEEKIAKHKLEMKLVAVEYTFDHSKILFYFSADGRVDFRELVKDLASVFRTRIELRQIGVRDEAKMIGGLGICGRPLCCTTFLDDFQPVSINMAKEQGLSLNPTKISGTCGRLMCCLKYESDTYKELIRTTPKVDSIVDTPQGKGTVMEVSLLKECCKVRLQSSPDSPVVIPCADCIRPGAAAPINTSENIAADEITDAVTAAETIPSSLPQLSGKASHSRQEARSERFSPASEIGDKEKADERSAQKAGKSHTQSKPVRSSKKGSSNAESRQPAQDKPRTHRQKPQHNEDAHAAFEKEKSERAPSSGRRRHRGSRGGQRRNHQENKNTTENHLADTKE